jgi:2-iminobutanoate/2-iminopropanoate deaminase
MNTTYGPYAPVRQVGNLLFISGQVGIDPVTKTAARDIERQTEQVLKNMEQALSAVGANLQDVVKTTVFLTDMDNFTPMNRVYEQVFHAPRPARSTVGVLELPRVGGETPILVEIEAVAYRKHA